MDNRFCDGEGTRGGDSLWIDAARASEVDRSKHLCWNRLRSYYHENHEAIQEKELKVEHLSAQWMIILWFCVNWITADHQELHRQRIFQIQVPLAWLWRLKPGGARRQHADTALEACRRVERPKNAATPPAVSSRNIFIISSFSRVWNWSGVSILAETFLPTSISYSWNEDIRRRIIAFNDVLLFKIIKRQKVCEGGLKTENWKMKIIEKQFDFRIFAVFFTEKMHESGTPLFFTFHFWSSLLNNFSFRTHGRIIRSWHARVLPKVTDG